MVELKDWQQLEGKLQFHSPLKQLDMGMHICIIENSQPESLYVGDLLYVSGAQEPMSVLWILVAPNTCAS